MILWAILLLTCGLGSGLAWTIYWQHRQGHAIQGQIQGLSTVSQHLKAISEDVEGLCLAQIDRHSQTQRSLHALHESLIAALTHLDQKEAQQAGLWTGAFLPDDASQAEYEARLRISEDRAISATHPIQYSSRPSPTSASGSRREPLIRPARRTGTP